MPLSEFHFKSEGVNDSGVVIVEGEKDAQGLFKKLSVKAFGKTFDISGEALKRFPIKTPNGIQLSYEKGYKEPGGRTVYVNFLFGNRKEPPKSALMLESTRKLSSTFFTIF